MICMTLINYYRSQEIDGQKYFIVGGYDHKTAHEENQEYRFLKLESHIRKYFEVKEIVYKWSSQYYESPDGLPYIGQFRDMKKYMLQPVLAEMECLIVQWLHYY